MYRLAFRSWCARLAAEKRRSAPADEPGSLCRTSSSPQAAHKLLPTVRAAGRAPPPCSRRSRADHSEPVSSFASVSSPSSPTPDGPAPELPAASRAAWRLAFS
eukprot:4082436-Prymnesium_polylepis.1